MFLAAFWKVSAKSNAWKAKRMNKTYTHTMEKIICLGTGKNLASNSNSAVYNCLQGTDPLSACMFLPLIYG